MKIKQKGSIFLVIFLVAAFFSLTAKVSAETNWELSEKEVMIDGVMYFINPKSNWAEASIEYIRAHRDHLPQEVTIHHYITYKGKTYEVESFDAAHDVESEMDALVQRKPSTLSYYQKYLKKITIEKGISLLNMGFSNYLSLEEVVFEDPKQMEEMGLYFYNCPKLKDLYIPADVNVLPRLRQCPNTRVIFDVNHPKYKVLNGDIYSKNGKILWDVPNGTEKYRIKPFVQTVGRYAFYGNDMVKKVIFSSKIKKVEADAFSNMKNLINIKFNKTLKKLNGEGLNEAYLCKGSKKLKTLSFPKNIRYITLRFDGKFYCKLKKIYIDAKKMKKIALWGLPTTCKIYVKNTTVRNQIRKSGFKGSIIIKK